ncbi:MAG: hypothetical protein AABZ32_03145 [Bacteroidota bacterium]
MAEEIYLHNNQIGKLWIALNSMRIPDARTERETRLSWFMYFFPQLNATPENVEEYYTELLTKYAGFIYNVKECHKLSGTFENYPKRLYDPTFINIHRILRQSWETPGGGWRGFYQQMEPYLINLEHIAEKASSVIGFKSIPTLAEIEEFTSDINEFDAFVTNSEYEAELKSRLLHCSAVSKEALRKFQIEGIDSFKAAHDEIWKELLFYIMKSGKLKSDESKQELKNSGVDKILVRISQFAAILATGNTLLSNDNIESFVKLLYHS